MKTRNITAAIVCGLLVILCCCCACTSSNLKVDCQDDKVTITASTEATTTAMGSFLIDEDQAIYMDCNIAAGNIDLTISNVYTGQTVYSECLDSTAGSDTIVVPSGSYAVSINADKMKGSVIISTTEPF